MIEGVNFVAVDFSNSNIADLYTQGLDDRRVDPMKGFEASNLTVVATRSCLFLFLLASVSSAVAQSPPPVGASLLASEPDAMSAAGS